jgi:hypothetical protein
MSFLSSKEREERLEVSLAISLDESSRRLWVTLLRCGALASEAVQ